MSEPSETPKPAKAPEKSDRALKLYLLGTAVVSAVCLIYIIYHSLALLQCRAKYDEAMSDLKETAKLMAQLPEKDRSGPQTIEDELSFFTAAVPPNSGKAEVEILPWAEESAGEVTFQEKVYVVRFPDGISRYHLASYIHNIERQKPFLKVKELDLQIDDEAPAHKERWKAQVKFAFRKRGKE